MITLILSVIIVLLCAERAVVITQRTGGENWELEPKKNERLIVGLGSAIVTILFLGLSKVIPLAGMIIASITLLALAFLQLATKLKEQTKAIDFIALAVTYLFWRAQVFQLDSTSDYSGEIIHFVLSILPFLAIVVLGLLKSHILKEDMKEDKPKAKEPEKGKETEAKSESNSESEAESSNSESEPKPESEARFSSEPEASEKAALVAIDDEEDDEEDNDEESYSSLPTIITIFTVIAAIAAIIIILF